MEAFERILISNCLWNLRRQKRFVNIYTQITALVGRTAQAKLAHINIFLILDLYMSYKIVKNYEGKKWLYLLNISCGLILELASQG
jgi:hypothetical protein